MSTWLAAAAGALVFATVWEILGAGAGDALRERLRGARTHATDKIGIEGWGTGEATAMRLRQAGLEGRIEPGAVLATRLAACAFGGSLTVMCLPAAPARIAPVLLAGGLTAGLLAPNAWLDRRIRRRAEELVLGLPDALDLVAVGVAAGRTPLAMLGEIGRAGEGVLAAELAGVAAAVECGATQAEALAALRERVAAPQLGGLEGAVARSARYGSPLAEQLHAQAAELRLQARRRIEERAARAAPKIQLVVAMVLVPSVLLTIAAALVAHSGALFGAL